MHLRTAAWIHARRLAEEPHLKAGREMRLLEAITQALSHVSSIWSAGRILPPQLRMMNLAAVLPLSLAQFDYAWTVILLALLVLFVVWRLRREYQLRSFIDDFGQRVYHYTNAAMYFNEQRFDDYLRRAFEQDPIMAWRLAAEGTVEL